MPTFLSRRYMRPIERISATEKAVGVFALLLTGGIVAAFVAQVATDKNYLFDVDEAAYVAEGSLESNPAAMMTPPDSTTELDPFPDPGVEGWRKPERVSRYSPENLYMKIDGRAPAYLNSGFVGLTFGTYHHQADSGRTIDVYWYDLGKPANASSMYHAEAAPDAAPVPIGSEGYQIGGAVFFWKGSSYIHVLPASLDEADAFAARRIAERLAEAIED